MRRWLLAAMLLSGAASAQDGARSGGEGEGNAVAKIRDCRNVGDDARRLACFDAAAAQIDGAIARKELIVLDKQEVRRTGRSLFGLPLPNLKLLTGNNGELDVQELDLKAVSVRPVSYQKYDITMEGGAVWRNVDLMVEPPRPGDVVHISKGMVGSFFMKAPKLQPVRAARVR